MSGGLYDNFHRITTINRQKTKKKKNDLTNEVNEVSSIRQDSSPETTLTNKSEKKPAHRT